MRRAAHGLLRRDCHASRGKSSRVRHVGGGVGLILPHFKTRLNRRSLGLNQLQPQRRHLGAVAASARISPAGLTQKQHWQWQPEHNKSLENVGKTRNDRKAASGAAVLWKFRSRLVESARQRRWWPLSVGEGQGEARCRCC